MYSFCVCACACVRARVFECQSSSQESLLQLTGHRDHSPLLYTTPDWLQMAPLTPTTTFPLLILATTSTLDIRKVPRMLLCVCIWAPSPRSLKVKALLWSEAIDKSHQQEPHIHCLNMDCLMMWQLQPMRNHFRLTPHGNIQWELGLNFWYPIRTRQNDLIQNYL